MYKAMIFLRRKPGVSRAAFRRWWLEQHRSLAAELPGLERHALNLLEPGAPFDAVVEQWFCTPDARTGAYDGAPGRRVSQDTLDWVEQRIRVAAEEYAFITVAGDDTP